MKHLNRIAPRKKLQIPFPELPAIRILLTELPIILIWAIAFLISFLTDYHMDPVGAGFRYTELLEYITCSLLICVATAILADLTERERRAGEQ